LKDFNSAELIIELIQNQAIGIDAIFHIVDNSDVTGTTNQAWKHLRNQSQISKSPLWNKISWQTIQASDYGGYREMFDIYANTIYSILNDRKNYQEYYKGLNVIQIPTFDKSVPTAWPTVSKVLEVCPQGFIPDMIIAAILYDLEPTGPTGPTLKTEDEFENILNAKFRLFPNEPTDSQSRKIGYFVNPSLTLYQLFAKNFPEKFQSILEEIKCLSKEYILLHKIRNGEACSSEPMVSIEQVLAAHNKFSSWAQKLDKNELIKVSSNDRGSAKNNIMQV
jgi:hypothetical protein